MFRSFLIMAATFHNPIVDDIKLVRVACIGDSITYGHGTVDDDHTYPAQLQGWLGSGYEVGNFGVPNASASWYGAISGTIPYQSTQAYIDSTDWVSVSPSIVVIMLGANDSVVWNAAAYKADYADTVDHYLGLVSKPKVYMILPTAVNINNIIPTEQIPILTKIANDRGIPLLNAYEITEPRPDLFVDGVHMNAVGYGWLARLVYGGIEYN